MVQGISVDGVYFSKDMDATSGIGNEVTPIQKLYYESGFGEL